MTLPLFPVVVDHGAGDCERFDTFAAFLDSSGCEEEDVASDAPVIVDVRRRCFAFSYARRAFTELAGPASPQASALLPTQA